MFYKLIEKKRNEWLSSTGCVVSDLISYIERQHKMRDAQIESIKTYLYLKIECQNKPLWKLVSTGKFNSIDVDDLEVNKATRTILKSNPAALALWEYASLPNEIGEVNSPKIIAAIKKSPESINYVEIIKELFANVDYPDYLFSIPMGAGKTYLMAALIYLNLYFALAEPENHFFAHNFILFVPSGLKSSIVPSLRDIQNFNPLWILPDPVATQLKNLIKYEWLQESSSASKSNSVKNPNARKISMHTANPNLMGLVAVTNAEKVILDRVDSKFNIKDSLLNSLGDADRKEFEAFKQANELREQIGRIPGLCILIDEVHHASDDQKLRQVVNKWMMTQSNFNSVLGFSGTPNMDPSSRIQITPELAIKCTQYANVVTYYPLIKGIGNFLKIPTVRHANLDSTEVISYGLREFFDMHKDTIYSNGACAKVAIYTPKIEDLEEIVYPEVCRICAELGLNTTETILKYHNGNKQYTADEDAQFEFSTLDSPLSKKRVILLVGIGREGWNCKSLAGVILSQKNSCPQNMVLQISCRCLRQVDNTKQETALIWLNKFNADKLNQQLQEQQYITIKEFGGKRPDDVILINCYSRMDKLKLPKLDFYQIKINYNTVETEKVADIDEYLRTYQPPYLNEAIIYTQTLTDGDVASESAVNYGISESVTFRLWLDQIVKEGFGYVTLSQVLKYEGLLLEIFSKAITSNNGALIYNPKIDQRRVRADIRNCFATIRRFNTTEELVPESASLLKVGVLPDTFEATDKDIFAPNQVKADEIISEDDKPIETISDEVRKYLIEHNIPLPESEKSVNDRTYHYLPYHLDSRLEEEYLNSVINYIKSKPGVEFYFNGDDTLTDFRIRCYTQRGRAWKLDGYYYPDFLMLTRNSDNTINKVVIIETKGEGFAGKFVPRKQFMEKTFIKLNNKNWVCHALTSYTLKTRLPLKSVCRKRPVKSTHSF